MIRKIWFVTLCVAVVLMALSVGMMVHVRARAAASRLPERSRAVRVAGLPNEVEVRLDDRGIAHIRSEDERAMWFAFGYVQARDRFFQMDLTRRMAAGRLSEIMGPTTLDIDRKMRIWRIEAAARRQATQLEVAERWVLDSYTAGINAALGQYGRWIAPETWFVGLDPAPWRNEDSLAIALLHQLSMSAAMGRELDRAVELARLGREKALDLWGWSPDEGDRWIPPSPPISTPRQEGEAILPSVDIVGSNGWAVAGFRSATGRPLLAADPHSSVSIPGGMYAIHLQCPELDVAGLSLPGVPGVLIGHNKNVAWGMASALVDDQDLYVLTLDEGRGRELIDDDWRELRAVSERIEVRWQDEESVKILISEHGPVVRERGREVLALEWVGLRARSPIRAILETDRAVTVQDVVEAWRESLGPYYQVVAADTDGRVLQCMTGSLPDRPEGAGRLPSPGQMSSWAWQGVVDLASRTIRLDPEEGIAVAANQDVFTEGDAPEDQRVPGEFSGPWRARRIRQELSSRTDWLVNDFVKLQADVTSDLAVAFMRQLHPVMESDRGPSTAVLSAWDGRMVKNSVAPHVYARLLLELSEAVGGDEAARFGLPSSPLGPDELLRLFAGGMDASWWDDVATEAVETRDETIGEVFRRLDLRRVSDDWGTEHRVTFTHPFTRVPVIGSWLGRSWSRGPFELGGDATTLHTTSWTRLDPFRTTAIPQARMVADVGSWDETVLVLAVGQSGRPWSAHYSDQIDPWLHHKPRSFPYSAEAVEAATVALLRLVPTNRGD